MKYKIFILVVTLLAIFTSCQTDEIDTYSSDNYIYFTDEGEDAINYSFAFYPGIEMDTISLEVNLIGQATEYDREIGLVVVDSLTTALDSDYSLPSQIVLKAGCFIDTISVIVYNTDKLLEEKLSLYLKITDSDDLLSGSPDYTYAEINFSDMLTQPKWWDDEVESVFLGTYSDAKYRLFIEATGVSDLTDCTESEFSAYALIFSDFLEQGKDAGEDYVDENGDPITIPWSINY